MIGSLLLFLGSAGYLGYKSASSQRAKANIQAHERNTGINVKRQFELELLAGGTTPYDRQRFINLLKNADLSRTSMRDAHEKKRKQLLEEFGKFDSYSRAYNKIHSYYLPAIETMRCGLLHRAKVGLTKKL